MISNPLKLGLIAVLSAACLGSVAGCETASELGDDAIRMGTFGRVQATPFMDAVETKDCRTSLSTALGFTQETRAMKQGVFVIQSFDCEVDRVVAKVSLTNHTPDRMFCYAETEETVVGVDVAPHGVSFFEYSYAESAIQDCMRSG